MILDLASVLSNAQAVTVTAASTGVYDVAGLGVGVAVTNKFGLQDSVFGEDLGGGGPNASAPQLRVAVGTAFTAAGAATLQVQLEAAIDDGTGNPSTWDIIEQTDTLAKTLLTAGQVIASFTIPKRYPGQAFPRFYRVNYVVATGPMTAGTVNAHLLTGVDDLPAYPAAY